MNTRYLQEYFNELIRLSEEEASIVDRYFSPKVFRKKSSILAIDSVCNFVAFIHQGCVRHFHIKDGDEITCDISFRRTFITEYSSFTTGAKSNIAFQALEETQLFTIEREPLLELYQRYPKFAEIGRKIAERVAERNARIAMSLASDKPEVRYEKLIAEQPEIFQRVPQKYIANFLGMTPESLSRIRKRVFTRQKS